MNVALSQVAILFRNRRQSVLYISLAILTIALEEIFEQTVFQCPCTDHMAYGMAFILAPALLLVIFGLVLDRDALVVLLPCTKSYNTDEHNAAENDTRKRAVKMFESLLRILEFMARASAAPMVWIVLSLLRKQYYVCAFFGPPVGTITAGADQLPAALRQENRTTDECGNTDSRSRRVQQIADQTHSQVLGCWLMAATLAIFLLLVVLRRCSRERRQFHMFGDHIYLHIEAKAAVLELHKEAKRLAEENGRRMVHQCLQIESSDNYIRSIAKARRRLVIRYHSYLIVPDSPTSPVTPSEGRDSGATDGPFSRLNSQIHDLTDGDPQPSSAASTPDCENMYIESRNLTRVIYLRQSTTTPV